MCVLKCSGIASGVGVEPRLELRDDIGLVDTFKSVKLHAVANATKSPN
jgi:hypothetical protein